MKAVVNILLFFLSFCSCSRPESPLNITIQFANSEKIDMKAGIYTVYFSSKKPVSKRFKLEDKEIEDIIQAKRILLQEWEPVQATIEDSCWQDPKFYTRVTVNSKKGLSVIDIDEGCSNYYGSNAGHAMRLNSFIGKIKKIVFSKKEIKAAPKSDISYM